MALRMMPTASASAQCAGRRTIAVRCQASSSVRPAASRRVAMLGAALAPLLIFSSPASALLLPDDDDEELVNKAKANRKARLVDQRATTTKFMQSEGLKDVTIESSLTVVQRTVVKLAQSGMLMEKGDLQGVALSFSDPWVEEFEVAAKKVPGGADALPPVLAGLINVRQSVAKKDGPASKRSFVDLVAALDSWTAAAGIKSKIQGL